MSTRTIASWATFCVAYGILLSITLFAGTSTGGSIAAQSGRFPAIKTFTVETLLGGWAKVQKEHFADGGNYDQIVVKR